MPAESPPRVRLAEPRDAAPIVDLVRECYGSSYRRKAGVDPVAVAQAIADGSLIYALAFSRKGEHVGQIALERLNEHGLYEHSRAVVTPAYRGSGLLANLDELLLGEVARERGVRYVVGKAVTSHTRTQGHCRSEGFAPTGLLLGLYPGQDVHGVELSTSAISAVVMVRRVEPSPVARRIALAGRDRDAVRAACDELGVPTLLARGEPSSELGATIERDEALGILHLRYAAGAPRIKLSSVLDASGPDARIAWADVPVSDLGAARTLALLRQREFGFGAFIPLAGPRGEDVIRLQRCLEAPPEAESIHVLDELLALRDAVLMEQVTLETVA